MSDIHTSNRDVINYFLGIPEPCADQAYPSSNTSNTCSVHPNGCTAFMRGVGFATRKRRATRGSPNGRGGRML
jgi:hypothetical protein